MDSGAPVKGIIIADIFSFTYENQPWCDGFPA